MLNSFFVLAAKMKKNTNRFCALEDSMPDASVFTSDVRKCLIAWFYTSLFMSNYGIPAKRFWHL